MHSPVRVTVHPGHYEDPLDDMELWSPDNPLFPWRDKDREATVEGDSLAAILAR